MAFIIYDSSGLAPKDGMGMGMGTGMGLGCGCGWRPVYSPKAAGGLMSSALQRKDQDSTSPHTRTSTRYYSASASAVAANTASFAILASRPPALVTSSRPLHPLHPSSSSSASLSPSSNVASRRPSSYHPVPPIHPHYIAMGGATGLSRPQQQQQPPPFSGPQLRDPSGPPPIDALPPELLDAVLATFPTPALLPLAAVSRRFYLIVARLIYRRLRRAVALANYQLLLACYHPSAKISTPYLHCAYLGTDGLDDDPDAGPDDALFLQRLPGMYSRFRPVPPDDADVHVRNYRAIRRTMNFFMLSDTASGGTPATALQTVAGGGRGEGGKRGKSGGPATATQAPMVAYDVHLDEGELFSQLCTVTNLVKTSSQPGLFLNCVNINDGVIRVWRDWLSGRVTDRQGGRKEDKEKEKKEKKKDKEKSQSFPSIADDPNQHVLWAYTGKHVGMRFRVTERASPLEQAVDNNNDNNNQRRATAPVEEPAVSFQLEYEELVVRTYELLLALEAAEVRDATSSGRGIIVASL
ncbi:hypothetical protein SCUCBS95973_005960 [Sporothrix curviconia]|uniref:F-box domain-containing protein n=1 Tax=Sporothrix curviconia TaxID=1260050 RepID=A0ABP0C3H1_9PEZI